MRAEVEQGDGSFLSEDRGEPECGRGFCDRCGDCLHCARDAGCVNNDWGEHRWVVYDERRWTTKQRGGAQ